MSYPQNGPDGASPDRRYPSVYQPVQPTYQPSPPTYQPSPPSYPPPQPPAQASYPPQPDQPWAPGSGGPAAGSAPFYEPTRQMPVGPGAGNPSAPPYGSPMSGPAYDSGLAAPQPPGRRGRATPVLAAVAVLLLLVGGVMTALYVTKNGELSDTKHDVASQEAKIKDLEGQLEKAKDDLTAARQDLTGTQNAQKETQRQKQIISKCLNLIADLGSAAARNDTAAVNRIGKQVDKACEEAEKYLD
jgi:hypothetical protein